MQFTRRAILASAGVAITGVGLSGCLKLNRPTMSRVRIYQSVSELASDSELIIVGEVASQERVRDIGPETEFTLATMSVAYVHKGSPRKSVIVRQFGSGGDDTVVELMESGRYYLLFLTRSGLSGELADQYYVTGASAGLYRLGGPPSSVDFAKASVPFEQVQPYKGEPLPKQVTLADVPKT